MKRQDLWKPSKYVLHEGSLRANRDPSVVSISSRLNVDLLGASLFREISLRAKGRLLDLGCGRVPLFETYRELVDSVLCADWDNSEHDLKHVDIPMDLNAPLPLEGNLFDTIVLSDVLEHIAEPDALFGEIRRILAPGGVVVGSVPFMYWLHEEPHDYFRYTEHGLRRFAAKQHFTVELLEPYGRGTDVLFDLLGKLSLSLHWRLGPHLARICQNAGSAIHSSRLGNWINRSASNMPLGYIFVLQSP